MTLDYDPSAPDQYDALADFGAALQRGRPGSDPPEYEDVLLWTGIEVDFAQLDALLDLEPDEAFDEEIGNAALAATVRARLEAVRAACSHLGIGEVVQVLDDQLSSLDESLRPWFERASALPWSEAKQYYGLSGYWIRRPRAAVLEPVRWVLKTDEVPVPLAAAGEVPLSDKLQIHVEGAAPMDITFVREPRPGSIELGLAAPVEDRVGDVLDDDDLLGPIRAEGTKLIFDVHRFPHVWKGVRVRWR